MPQDSTRLLGSSLEVLQKGIDDIRTLATCMICTNLMFEPYTTKCGHTFCYGCLAQWVDDHQRRCTCPECRRKIKEEPAPNFTIRNIVHVLTSNTAYLEDGETSENVKEEQIKRAQELEHEKASPTGLFKGRFASRIRGPIHDAADGVMRCIRCNWELEGNYCHQCDISFEPDSAAEFSDEDVFIDEDGMQVGYIDMDEEGSDYAITEDEDFIDDASTATAQEMMAIREAALAYDDRGVMGTAESPYELSSDIEEDDGRYTDEEAVRYLDQSTNMDDHLPLQLLEDGDDEEGEGSSEEYSSSGEESEEGSSSGSESGDADASFAVVDRRRNRNNQNTSRNTGLSRARARLAETTEAGSPRRRQPPVVDLTRPRHGRTRNAHSFSSSIDDEEDREDEPVRRTRSGHTYSSQEPDAEEQQAEDNTGVDEDETSTSGSSESETSDESSTAESEPEQPPPEPTPQPRSRKRVRVVISSDEEEAATPSPQPRRRRLMQGVRR